MSLAIWMAVPDGSEIELSLKGNGAFVGRARVLMDTNGDLEDETWEDQELHPGPKVAVLSAPTSYTLRVLVAFAGPQTTVTIRGRIVTPNGNQHGDEFVFPVSGKNGGKPGRATLVAITG